MNGKKIDPLKEGGVKTDKPAPQPPSGGGMAGEAQPGGDPSVSEETGEPARKTGREGGMLGQG